MRMLPLLVVLPLCAAPALAQTAAPPSTTITQAAQSAAANPTSSDKGPTAHRRGGWEQRFAAANTSHDGHLTLEQAKSGYITVARHFDAIDVGRKGYVTTDDLRAWHKTQREARHGNARRSDHLQPRPAMHRTMIEVPAIPSGPPPAPKGIDPKAPS